MTSPTMRDLLMGPRNVFGVQQAVVSFLAGDVFRSGPVMPRILLFRAHLLCLASRRLPRACGPGAAGAGHPAGEAA